MSRRHRNNLRIKEQATATPEPDAAAHMWILFGVIACFVLSGFAALLYQTAWMRQFSVVFGTSELAVATVLSTYMAGLALGAAIAGRVIHRITRPVLTYGLLEAAIATSALAVPFLLKLANSLYVGVLGGQSAPPDASGLGQSFFYILVAFIVLVIPTGCMGATLPMLIKYVVRSERQIGPRVGLLYAVNTVGAVAGTVVAGFFLLPALGLSGTVWVGVAVNGLVFLIAAALSRFVQSSGMSEASEAEVAPEHSTPVQPGSFRWIGPGWILPLMLLSGANTFAYEVLWTRLLGHILGGSIAAFSTMLASFLGGIAIGSAIAARLATDRVRAFNGFVVAQCGIALTSIIIYQVMHLLIPEDAGLADNALLAIAILLPATLFVGATFPFAVRILAESQADAAPSSARVYAWNTMGAIVGAVVAGYILIPLFRYEGAIQLAVMINTALALVASLVILRRRYRTAAAAALLVAIVAFVYRPTVPEEILLRSPLIDGRDNGEIRYYEVGRSATVLLMEEDGFFNLRTNGLPEASANLTGAPPYQHNQRMLSMLPVIARPDTRDMLIIGFGAGVAVEGVPKSLESVDVIELEPKVIEANRLIGPERQVDPLTDPRINVVINDARSALYLTSKRYDAIVSQPSHPWTAGASHLYTREFMELAADHLRPGGVFLQWMNSQFVTESLLRSLCATMLDVYDYVRVYEWDPEALFFLGSNEPLDVEYGMAMTGRPLTDDPVHYLENGVGSVEDVLMALVMDQRNIEQFARGESALTDDFNRMATESAFAIERNETLRFNELVDLLLPYDPLLQADSWVHRDFPVDLEFAYVAERLERSGYKKRAVELSNTLQDLRSPDALLLIGMGLARQGEELESQRILLEALLANPSSSQIRFAILQPWLSRLYRTGSEIPGYVADIARNVTGQEAAVLSGWQAAMEGNLQQLANLDRELSLARTTDLWYLEAVKMRADWRIKVTTPEYQPRFAREAKRLIDNAIAIYQDPEFYSMRVAAAFVANDALDVIETARRLIYIFGTEVDSAEAGRLDVGVQAIDLKLSQVNAVRDVLEQVRRSHEIPGYKIEQLERDLAAITRRLNNFRTKEIAGD